MSRRRVATVVALAVAAAAAGVAVLVLRDGAEPRAPSHRIEARGELSPRILFFGDTLTARIDVTLDPRRIDPASLRFEADFATWELVGRPVLTRADAPETTFVRMTWTLRCLIRACAPQRGVAPLEFDPALVTYRGGVPIQIEWPVLYVNSRLREADENAPEGLELPWRIDVVSLPAVSYRVSPRLLTALLLAAAGILALVGLVFVHRALPKRRPAPAPPPEPRPPPPSALEQALALLEQPGQNGSADRRRALELVADELAARDHVLASAARALAWSEDTPPDRETKALAARARDALALENDDAAE